MQAFWTDQPLTESQQALLNLVFEAHCRSALRENISTHAVALSAQGSGSYTNAIAAALCTLGGVHAPIEETYKVLTNADYALQLLEDGKKVPGWGNSFHKEADPLWENVNKFIKKHYPDACLTIEAVTEAIEKVKGKRIHPNPSCYTAATAIILGIPSHLAAWLFVQGRLAGWSMIFKANA